MSRKLELVTDFRPTGDQPQAIEELVESLGSGADHQTLEMAAEFVP